MVIQLNAFLNTWRQVPHPTDVSSHPSYITFPRIYCFLSQPWLILSSPSLFELPPTVAYLPRKVSTSQFRCIPNSTMLDPFTAQASQITANTKQKIDGKFIPNEGKGKGEVVPLVRATRLKEWNPTANRGTISILSHLYITPPPLPQPLSYLGTN